MVLFFYKISLYVILHGTVSIHLRDSKHAQIVKERTKNNSMEKDVKMDVKKEEGVKEKQMMEEASERRLPAPPPLPSPPPHPISWEASKFCCDEPTTRVAGTLQSTGGKYLVTLHPGQAFGEQALAGDDEGKDIPRSASCVSGTFLNFWSCLFSSNIFTNIQIYLQIYKYIYKYTNIFTNIQIYL